MLGPIYFLSSLLTISLPSTSARAVSHHTGLVFTPTNYSVVPGIFIQDSPSFNATGYNSLNDSFGLIDKSPKRWENLTRFINKLNHEADDSTVYKLIYIARHGQGFHNQAETTYGTPAWNCYWSELYTDGNITWGPDAKLTPTGIAQAESVNLAWKEQIKAGIPLPATLYSSPMSRATSTLNITWKDILIDPRGIKPIIKENFRESIGLHTCDQRSNKSYIAKTYPSFAFETPFSFHDELWGPVFQEQSGQQALRTQQILNQVFAKDSNTFISITAHSGTITGFFKAVNHQAFGVQPGGFVPVLVKAVSYATATNALLVGGQSGTAPVCTANPTTVVRAPATATVSAVVITAAPTTTSSS